MSSTTQISTSGVQVGTIYLVSLLRQELGKRIQQARYDAGLTQRELAEKIGLKNATDISRYERGVVEVRSRRIDAIAEATGKPRSYFTRGRDEPEMPDPQEVQRLEERIVALHARHEEQLGEVLELVQELRNELLRKPDERRRARR